MLRPSRYNVYGRSEKGRTAIFNTLTQNLVIVDDVELAGIRNGVANEAFLQTGLVVYSETDELQVARSLRSALKQKGKVGLSVTLVPSLGCNFSCGYCYNGLHSAPKTDEAPLSIQRGFGYAVENLDYDTVLRITWYGGEPGLFQKQIPEWSQRFMTLARERRCGYEADILTNGSAITEETGGRFIAAGIKSAQVSIDWPPSDSGRRMGSLSARDTALAVLDKLDLLPSSLNLTLRINTFPGFLETFPDLIGEIRSRVRRSMHVYCHRVYVSNDIKLNSARSVAFRYRNTEDYSKDYLAAKNLLRGAGYPQEFFPEDFMDAICLAQSAKSAIINPSGELKKCPREVSGPGATFDSQGQGNTEARFYQAFDSSETEPCKSCRFLPICHGGCVKEAFDIPGSTDTRCTLWKFTMEDELSAYARQLNAGADHA